MESMGWEQAIANWRDYMLSAGMPPTTIGLRCYHLDRVAREVGRAPHTITLEDLTCWLASKSWAPNTRRSYRASLRAFYRWAMATGKVQSSPAHLLPVVKVPRAQPRPTPEAVFRLAIALAEPRERRAILLAGICGLRRGELARTRREHLELDLTGWSLRVLGKGGHERMVPLPDDLAHDLLTCPPGYLFPSSQGGHLTPAHLGKLVSRWLEEHTTHTLRHRCGTVAYAATHDLRAVQELLGHAKPETTAIYTAVPASSVRAAMMGAA